jgi:hypothetical protein
MKPLASAALTEDGWNIGGRPKCRSLVEATGRCHGPEKTMRAARPAV